MYLINMKYVVECDQKCYQFGVFMQAKGHPTLYLTLKNVIWDLLDGPVFTFSILGV